MSSQPQQPPSAAEMIAGSEDLLTEILTNLPVKPLLRFKSVSKQFLSVISHPSFSLLHSLRHRNHPSAALFFLHHHRHRHSSPSFSFIPLTSPFSQPPPFFSLLKTSPNPIDILQSCNGLLLCSSNRIVNPTTNQIVTVSLPLPRRTVLGLNLAFDLSLSPHYRIICVWKIDEDVYAIDVFSSENHKWRPVIDSFTAPFDSEFERGVYCHSRVYWLSHTETMAALDVEREVVEMSSLPNGNAIQGAYIERFRYFGESCGCLHLIEIPTNCVSKFDVLELDRGNEVEWRVKFRVDLNVLGRGFEDELFQDHSDRFGRQLRFYAFSILAVVRRRDDDDWEGHDGFGSTLVVSIPGKVISYDLKDEVSRLLCDILDDSDKWLPFRGYNAFQFIESLYCL